MVENCNLSILSQQERAIYKARTPTDFLSLAPKLSWSSLGLLISKAEKLIDYYADRDMFDNLTAMFQTVDRLHGWLTIRIIEDVDAPDILKRDTEPAMGYETGAVIVKNGRVIRPNVLWLKR